MYSAQVLKKQNLAETNSISASLSLFMQNVKIKQLNFWIYSSCFARHVQFAMQLEMYSLNFTLCHIKTVMSQRRVQNNNTK